MLAVARELGLHQVKVAVVLGDDVLTQLGTNGLSLPILESAQTLADLQPRLISANAYLGAEALLAALQSDAQVIITGRVADPALFLAPLMHHFGWAADDWTRLGKGVLVGDTPARLIQAARAAGRRVVVDPKGRDYGRRGRRSSSRSGCCSRGSLGGLGCRKPYRSRHAGEADRRHLVANSRSELCVMNHHR